MPKRYAYYETPEHPLREVLQAMVGKEPPAFVRGYDTSGYSDEEQQALQAWCCSNARPHWLTGIGIIEAAETQIAEAVANGNILPKDSTP